MHINARTMLFTDLSEDEADDLYELACDIIMNGVTNWHNMYVQEWFQQCNLTQNSQQLVMYSIALPQRITLSLCDYYRAK